MRRGVIAHSLLVLSFTLASCDGLSRNSQPSSANPDELRLVWNDAAARQLREAIDRRAAHGLDGIRFTVEGTPDSSDGQEGLTRSALHYAAALAQGATDPNKVFSIYTVPRPAPDLRVGLAKALADGDVAKWLESLAPQDDSYRKLSAAYLTLRKAGGAGAAVIPPPPEPLKPGASDPRIPAIKRQLRASDYLERTDPSERYDPITARAVQLMQADYGIEPDGVIGTETLEILNLSDAEKARAIGVAMERMRWLERNPPATRIDVNLASARLTYWRDGKVADTRRVVVGAPETETPQLGSPIYRLVANPTWTVPRSIQTKEIEGKGAAYLRRNNMTWKDGWIVQQSGPKNSLGLVKFDMKNDHQIYLHDTPAKQLFGEVQRQRSHGCVRVEDAVGFAEMLARDEGITDQWQRARATGKESFVSLPREIPVRLFYQTVLFDDAGAPQVRADPYGWNDRVATALGYQSSKSYRLRPSNSDVGP
ncbi:MAG: L,D-transpeptidase family protein [Porphyrobacter sp.]|nr:L,D-transpeptidase family protein [Porphyrobacter sp.]